MFSLFTEAANSISHQWTVISAPKNPHLDVTAPMFMIAKSTVHIFTICIDQNCGIPNRLTVKFIPAGVSVGLDCELRPVAIFVHVLPRNMRLSARKAGAMVLLVHISMQETQTNVVPPTPHSRLAAFVPRDSECWSRRRGI